MSRTLIAALTLAAATFTLVACDHDGADPIVDTVTPRADPDLFADLQWVIDDPIAKSPVIGGMIDAFECVEGVKFTVKLRAITVSTCEGGVRYACKQENAITYECIEGEPVMIDETVDVSDCEVIGTCGEPETLPW